LTVDQQKFASPGTSSFPRFWPPNPNPKGASILLGDYPKVPDSSSEVRSPHRRFTAFPAESQGGR